MGLYRRKDSPYFWYDFHRDGKKVNKSTGVTDKKLAQKIYEKALNTFNSEQHGFTPSSITLKGLLDHWIKWAKRNKTDYQQDTYQCGILLEFFGSNTQAASIKSEDIERFRDKRKEDGLSISTINRNCALLRAAYNLAFREGTLKHNPMRNIRFYNESSKARVRFLTEDERERLITACSDRIKPLVLLALNTGMREGELLNLRWDNIDLTNKLLRVVRTKSGKPRSIPLNSEALLVLNQKAIHRGQIGGSEYVFPTAKETKRPWYSYRKAWETAVRDSGIQDLTFHDLRHTFASQLVSRGVDLYTVGTILGHSSLKMTQRYAHLAPEGLQRAVEKLSQSYYNSTTDVSNTNLNVV